MSINNYVDDIEAIAQTALAQTKALKVCPFHKEVTIRIGDTDAERHAYAIATNMMKKEDTLWMRDDVLESIKYELDMAADGECPRCGGDDS